MRLINRLLRVVKAVSKVGLPEVTSVERLELVKVN